MLNCYMYIAYTTLNFVVVCTCHRKSMVLHLPSPSDVFLHVVMQEGSYLKSKGRASDAARVGILTWRSLLIMSRDLKYFWNRLLLYMLLALSIGTMFIDTGHSLSSVAVSTTALLRFNLLDVFIFIVNLLDL